MSIKSVSFEYKGERFVTIFGCGSYLNTVVQEWPGVAKFVSIATKSGYNASFTKEFGMTPRDTPMIDNAEVTPIEQDDCVNVYGNITVDGVLHAVRINKDGLFIDGHDVTIDEEELAAAEPEETVEETSSGTEETVIVESKEYGAPEVIEHLKADGYELNPEEDASSSDEVGSASNGIEEALIGEQVSDATVEVAVEPVVPKVTTSTSTAAPNTDKRIRDVDMSVGFHMGTASSAEPLIIGSRSVDEAGFYVDRKVQPIDKRALRKHTNTTSSVPIHHPSHLQNNDGSAYQETILSPDEVPVEPTVGPTVQKLASAWNVNATPIQSVTGMTDEQKEAAIKKAAKDRLRAKFSNEVNAAIGDIPHNLLGDLTEFTLTPVNYEKLHEDGMSYCIENRWHKSGNWFCIDVVNEGVRAFYNVKQGRSVAVPVEDCKAWLKVVS